MRKEDYIVTQISDGSFDVYNEAKGILYRVDKKVKRWSCNCPHWHFRLRLYGANCKHIDLVKEQGGWA